MADRSLRSVFVGNIPYEATEETLKDIFSEVGPVVSFRLVYDRDSGKPKGYGFCEYKDQETALSAMRNLNGHELNGRALRVDNAASEKSKEELKNLAPAAPALESPYGDGVQPNEAPEAISKAVASLPPEQMFELMKQMKMVIQNNPVEARNMLLQNPQLAYALLQAQVVMRIVNPEIAMTLLHKQTDAPQPLVPAEPQMIQQQGPPGGPGPSQQRPGPGPPQQQQSPMMQGPGPGMHEMGGPRHDMGGPPRHEMGGPPPGHEMGGPPRQEMGGPRHDMGGPPRHDMGGPRPQDMGGPRPDMGGPRPGMHPTDQRGGPGMGDPHHGRNMGGPGAPNFPGGPGGPGGPPQHGDRGQPGMMQHGGNGRPMDNRGPPGHQGHMGHSPMQEPMGGMDPRGMPQQQRGHEPPPVSRSHDPRGPDPRGHDNRGHDPRGPPDQRGHDSRGPDPRGGMDPRDARRGDPRGYDPRGGPQRGGPPAAGDMRGPAPGPSMGPGGPGALPGVAGPGGAVGPGGSAAQPTPQDHEKAALIMQVLQLSQEQIMQLPPEQRQSIMVLKEQISRSQGAVP